jgi:transcriptional regulator with XRE-family HTH domain
MALPLHEQIRAARNRQGLSQQKLANLAGVARSVLQRLEEGDNVGIRTIEKVIGPLPEKLSFADPATAPGAIAVDMATLHDLGMRMVNAGAQALRTLGTTQPAAASSTPELDELRRVVLEMIGIGAEVLQMLEQPQEKRPQEPAGATRYRGKPVVSEALKEHLRRINPVYNPAKHGSGATPQREEPPAEPPPPERKV